MLIERARILVDWVGRGRTITRDAAIRRQDAADLMLRLDIADSDWPERGSMWDVDTLAAPWMAATTTTGMLLLKGRKVLPGRRAEIWERDDAREQAETGRRAVQVALEVAFNGPGDHVKWPMLAYSVVMLAAMVASCGPDGLNLKNLEQIEAISMVRILSLYW